MILRAERCPRNSLPLGNKQKGEFNPEATVFIAALQT